jgi:hypothetical protein
MAAGKTAKKLSTGIGVNPVTAHIPQRRLNNGGCCMKNVFFISVFILVSAAIFAQQHSVERVYTSEGYYIAGIEYVGQYCGQQHADISVDANRSLGAAITTNIKLTNGQWECVRKMLGKYNTSRGDTFIIMIFLSSGSIVRSIDVVCEFTSASQYKYWAISKSRYWE